MDKALKYYRISLADGERMTPQVPKHPPFVDNIVDLTYEQVHNAINKKGAESYDIIACPFRITSNASFGKKQEANVFPFWVPLKVSKDIGVIPPESDNIVPWFIRGVLEPNEVSQKFYPILGHVGNVDKVLSTFKWDKSDLEKYLKHTRKFFKKINGNFWDELEFENWTLDCESWIFIEANSTGMAFNISNLYNYLSAQKKLPPLLKTVLTFESSRPQTIKNLDDAFAKITHYGQMSAEFPLATSQRASMVGFSKLKEGDILAVNGPPGTGKTTLLQSAFGHSIVESVLKSGKDPEPARILASSMNNQAITNILDSCQDIKMAPGLSERWLPKLSSFGTYLTNKKGEDLRQANEKGYLTLSKSSVKGKPPFYGWYYDYIQENSPDECMAYFKSYFQKYFGKQALSVNQMLSLLKEEITQRQETIRAYLETAVAIKELGIEDNVENSLKKSLDLLDCQKNDLKDIIQSYTRTWQKTQEILVKKSLINKALSLLPSVKKEKLEKLKALLEKAQLPEPISVDPIATFSDRFESCLKDREKEVQALEAKLTKIDDTFNSYKRIKEAWKNLKSKNNKNAEIFQDLWDQAETGERINILCDLELRHESLWLAVHYWELNWLKERDDKYVEKIKGGSRSKKNFFRILSHLTPFFVSTFHSAPGFCACWDWDPSGNKYFNEYLIRFFDMLVVDEGGQISPEVAVPTFALAQKALVVGDVKQIEPVWNITSPHIDKSNLQLANKASNEVEYKELEEKGLLCCSGSVLKIAQNRSLVHYPKSCDEKGTMLQEHRRCVDEIIEYSNIEIYKGLLIPKVGSLDDAKKAKQRKNEPFFKKPALGYLNVPGESSIYNGSRQNKNEAEAIATWIKKHEQELEEIYKGPIEKSVGVVTPFRAQKNLIKGCLKSLNIGAWKKITVGTVHALQGAERPVILFSPVYGTNDHGGSFFFDADFNMLNVALSRAKQHFFVFGTLQNFDPWASTPSGRLAKYLFADRANELAGGFLYDNEDEQKGILHKNPGIGVKRINDLDMHNRSLQLAISNRSKERVIIVSPFISSRAIEDGELLPHFEKAQKKNVKVVVYTDAFLDRKNGELKPTAKEGRQILEDHGVEVIEKKGIHSKSMAIDKSVLLEGSFDWLSAVRDVTSPYHRHEVTMVYKGEGTDMLINELEKELSALK